MPKPTQINIHVNKEESEIVVRAQAEMMLRDEKNHTRKDFFLILCSEFLERIKKGVK